MRSLFSIAPAIIAFGLCSLAAAQGEIRGGGRVPDCQGGAAGSSIPAQTGKPGGASKGDQKGVRSGPLRFIWPVSGRRIVERYGERTNSKTGIVTMNPGINIAARKGSAVVASEDGRVSLVSWLPGYGTIVIVEHRDRYRTVYGNLAAASVSRGEKVVAGRKIGTVGTSLGAALLHFEVWRDQTRLDPATVLR